MGVRKPPLSQPLSLPPQRKNDTRHSRGIVKLVILGSTKVSFITKEMTLI